MRQYSYFKLTGSGKTSTVAVFHRWRSEFRLYVKNLNQTISYCLEAIFQIRWLKSKHNGSTGKVMQDMQLLKSSFWAPHSDYSNDVPIPASKIARFFLRRNVQVLSNTFIYKHKRTEKEMSNVIQCNIKAREKNVKMKNKKTCMIINYRN